MNLLDWICVAAYVLLLFGISAYHARKIQRQDDMFLAGRCMSSWPIAMSMYMALFSTNTFLGSTGWVNRPNGTVWIGLQTVGIVFAVPLIVWLYPSLFFRLRITSAYEYLDFRFNASVRATATWFFLGSRLMWMSTMLYSSSLVVSSMTGWTGGTGQIAAILLIGGLSTAFSLMGGMHSIIWTDVLQFGILAVGLVLMITIGSHLAGGFVNVIRIGNDSGKFDAPAMWSLTDELSVFGGLLFGFTAMVASAGSDQVVLQQYLTARTEEEAKRSMWRNGIYLKPMSLIYPFLGLIIFAYLKSHPEVARLMRIPDDALPVFVTNVLPHGVRGLMVVAMMAAVLTSVQAGLAAVSAALQVNFITPYLRRAMTDRESVFTARALLLGSGIVVMAAAMWVRTLGQQNSIIQILNIVMFPFSGVLLGIFLLGIVTHRASGNGVMLGGILGFIGTAIVPAIRLLAPSASSLPVIGPLIGISNFLYGVLGTVLTFTAGYAASLLMAPPPPGKIIGLTRWSMPPAEEPAAEQTLAQGGRSCAD